MEARIGQVEEDLSQWVDQFQRTVIPLFHELERFLDSYLCVLRIAQIDESQIILFIYSFVNAETTTGHRPTVVMRSRNTGSRLYSSYLK